MKKEIIFRISKKTGLIEAETFGFVGRECERELNFLKQISGDELESEFKDDGQPNYAVTDSQ